MLHSREARPRWVHLVLLSSVACVAPAAAAAQVVSEYPSASLEWRAPSECVSEAELIVAVRERLEREAIEAITSGAELHLHVEIMPTEDGRYRAELRLEDASNGEPLGSRSLVSDHPDCRSLDDPLAVVVAMMLNVRREDLGLPMRRGPAGWNARVDAGAGAIIGLLPNVGLEVSAAVRLEERGTLGIALELAYDWADTARVLEGALSLSAASLRIAIAPELLLYPVSIFFRASVGVGLMWGEAKGFAVNRSQVRVFLEVRAGVELAVEVVDPVFLFVAADAVFVPLGPEFRLDDPARDTTEHLFAPSIVGGAFRGGVAIRFF